MGRQELQTSVDSETIRKNKFNIFLDFNGILALRGVDFEDIRMGWNLYEQDKIMNNEVQVVVLGWPMQIILTNLCLLDRASS